MNNVNFDFGQREKTRTQLCTFYIVIAMKCTLKENDKHLWEERKVRCVPYIIPLDIGQIRYRFINTKLSWISHESRTDGTQELLNSKNKQ